MVADDIFGTIKASSSRYKNLPAGRCKFAVRRASVDGKSVETSPAAGDGEEEEREGA